MRDRGQKAEDIAAKTLQKKGYKILERNFSSRFGEIDIIAQKGEYLVFVEVKFRKNEAFGGGMAAVDFHKQARIRKTAAIYLQKLTEQPCVRFDVVTLTGSLEFRQKLEIDIIENAFY